MSTLAITPSRVLRSEWHKLWTVRSTWITLALASALTIGIGLAIAATYESGGGDADVDTVLLVLLGMQFTSIIMGVLGILVTAGEHSTGMIRSSMTAVPRRLPVLWSKAAVLGAVTFTVVLATNFITFPLAQTLLSGTDQEASLGDPGIARALVGNAAGLALLGVMALALGALIRSVPGSIGAFIGGVLVLPEILSALPYDVIEDAVRYFPVGALDSLTHAHTPTDMASPGAALLALSLWAAGTLAAAGLLLRRRDV
ncbi:ABC transporter permease [Streptomyces sporangiiformans]|uniref:ABC transporter permease n=1 Tax=Streptomyces sporangiiformans TaxID=2315329 RepID=A0A505D731_9ACTN|nr:ABC transporter permease [Streptomyces sporangiiformans]TPQ17585.1 ABC transporter permease [Streptomyces sporangiiformans]